MSSKKLNILLGITGSVATIKIVDLIKYFTTNLKKKSIECEIRLVVTKNSLNFVDINQIPDSVIIYEDKDEYDHWHKIGDPVLHIELRKWADFLLIAPLDANTLAKISNGICDNLLTCVIRAWNMERPLFFATAMNTFMYKHPITNIHLKQLEKLGYLHIEPICKILACKDEGIGAMEEIDKIYDFVLKNLK